MEEVVYKDNLREINKLSPEQANVYRFLFNPHESYTVKVNYQRLGEIIYGGSAGKESKQEKRIGCYFFDRYYTKKNINI